MDLRCQEIEADFQRYYQLDLAGIFTGALTLRKFSALLYGLPAGAETWVAQGGPKAREQATEATLHVWQAIGQFQQAFAEKPQAVPYPDAPEWGYQEIEAEKRVRRQARAEAWLARQNNKQ